MIAALLNIVLSDWGFGFERVADLGELAVLAGEGIFLVGGVFFNVAVFAVRQEM